MRRAVAFSLLLASILGGCVLATDFSGLSGGAGPGGPDGSSPDVTSVIPGREGGTGTPSDAGTLIDSGDWCSNLSPQPKKCLDFDDGSGFADYEKQVGGAKLSIGSVASSAPDAVYALMNANAVGNAYFEVPLGTSPSIVRYAFDVDIDSYSGYFEFNPLRFSYDDLSYCAIQVALSSQVFELEEYCQGAGSGGDGGIYGVIHDVGPIVSTPGFYTFDIRIDLGAHTLAATILRPDGSTISLPITTIGARLVPGATTALVGISYAQNASPPAGVRIDNVLVDFP